MNAKTPSSIVRWLRTGIACTAVASLSSATVNASYIQVASWSDIAGPGSTTIQNFLFTPAGDLIVALNGTSSGGVWSGQAVNLVTGIGTPSPVRTEIMGSGTWGNNSFTPLRSTFQVNGGVLSFGVTGVAAVAGFYDLNLASGTLTNRTTATNIQDAIPGNFNMSPTATQVPNGDFFIYNSNNANRSLLRVSGSTPSTVLDGDGIVAVFGAGGTVIQSMTALSDGRLIMANGQNNVIAVFDPVTLGSSQLLTAAELGSRTFQNFFAAPDGMVYFNDSNREIWKFDPTNAAATLELVIDRDGIEAGPAGTSSLINALGWYDGNIAWAPGGNNPPGIYAIPEPSTYAVLASLAVFGFVLWRRRR